MKNINHEQQESGWVITGVGNMHVLYFVKTHCMKIYGKYVNQPVGVSGKEHVLNIQTEEDCVHLSMIGHFPYKNALDLHNLSHLEKFYRSKEGKYFTFPEKHFKPFFNSIKHNWKRKYKILMTRFYVFELIYIS